MTRGTAGRGIALFALLAAGLLRPAAAADFPFAGALGQGEFRALSEDLGAVVAYRAVTPATPLGLLGFDVGIGLTHTGVENASALRQAGAGSHSSLVAPTLHVHKGLPGRFDVGFSLARVNDIDATVYGAELRYAVLDDGLATPAVALRLSGSGASGLGELRVRTAAADLMLSKKLAVLTPYAGAGIVRVMSSVGGSALADERFNRGRIFVGLNLNLLAANLAVEAGKMGDNTSISAKLGVRF